MADPLVTDLFDYAPPWFTFDTNYYPTNLDTESYPSNHPLVYNDMTPLFMSELDFFWPPAAPSPSATPSPTSTSPLSPSAKPLSRRNTRVGYCEHPKHELYRHPDYQSFPSRPEPTCRQTRCRQLCDDHHFLLHHQESPVTPRRGRPPKGTKPLDLTHPLGIAMTTRPLPKRLEAVVGGSNIHVCLTCLKRSDLDTEYLTHPAYLGPQTTKKKKRG